MTGLECVCIAVLACLGVVYCNATGQTSRRQSPVPTCQQDKRSALQVYDPIVEGSLLKRPEASAPARPPSRPVRNVAVAASFIISGLIHELMFWCAPQDASEFTTVGP